MLVNLDFIKPLSYDEAILHPDWQEAMEKELQAFMIPTPGPLCPYLQARNL